MGIWTNYFRNKFQDWRLRGQTFARPATVYFGILTTTKGPRANSTVYALNDTISVLANDGALHLYKATTAGTSAAAQSTLYPGAKNEIITDGSAVFTEQESALRAGTAAVEPSGGSYARVALTASMANVSGTQSAGSTAASSGTAVASTISNNVAITFPAPTADWKYAWALAIYDASTAGNMEEWLPMTTPKTINNGDAAPAVAIGVYQSSIDA